MSNSGNVLSLLKTELVDQLGGASVDVFSKLDVRDWGAFFKAGIRLDFDHNAIILQEGQPGDAVYFLAEGEVRVEQKSSNVSIELARLISGSIFGEMSFLDGADVSASVIAEGHVEVVRVSCADLKTIMDEDSRFAYPLLSISRRCTVTSIAGNQ